MIIELSELQPILDFFPQCPKCKLGRAIVIEENAGPHSWDVVAMHNPTCRGARPAGPRHLHPVSASTGSGDVA